jgi:predicted Zn-dependent protease
VLRSAIREMPSAAFLHRELSRVAEDSEEALDAARAAATLEPDNPALKRRLAARLQAEGRSAQAEVELRSVLEIEPHSADDYYRLSKFLKRQGRLAEATDAARQAVLNLSRRPDVAKLLRSMDSEEDAARILQQSVREGAADAETYTIFSRMLENARTLNQATE